MTARGKREGGPRVPAMGRLRFAPLVLALGTLASPSGAATPAPRSGEALVREGYERVRQLLSPESVDRQAAARQLIAGKDPTWAAPLVDLLFFLPAARRGEAIAVLRALTGERGGERYHDWVDVIGRRQDLRPPPGYLAFKGSLLARIDPRYSGILQEKAPVRLRVEEIVWGGVPVEGIPALDQPDHIPAREAAYLDDAERVFGVSLGGERRAYPLRIMDWHEMLNDIVGGEPITLSYCTLCGSGVLYSTRVPDGPPLTFGTSGLLYRSNKLMIDRRTQTLWSNLTGEPTLGPLAGRPLRLPILPLTVTTWGEWRARHPDTSVLALDAEREQRYGFRYVPGAADRRRAGVRFPIWPRSAALPDHAEIYAVRLAGRAKAYPIAALLKQRVVNDRLGEQNLVLIADPASGAVRAYARGERPLELEAPSASGDLPGLRDADGHRWRVEEERLVTMEGAEASLPRLPGHQAFWFGWYSFFPDTEVYGVDLSPDLRPSPPRGGRTPLSTSLGG